MHAPQHLGTAHRRAEVDARRTDGAALRVVGAYDAVHRERPVRAEAPPARRGDAVHPLGMPSVAAQFDGNGSAGTSSTTRRRSRLESGSIRVIAPALVAGTDRGAAARDAARSFAGAQVPASTATSGASSARSTGADTSSEKRESGVRYLGLFHALTGQASSTRGPFTRNENVYGAARRLPSIAWNVLAMRLVNATPAGSGAVEVEANRDGVAPLERRPRTRGVMRKMRRGLTVGRAHRPPAGRR
jgi:hypothetical protein